MGKGGIAVEEGRGKEKGGEWGMGMVVEGDGRGGWGEGG